MAVDEERRMRQTWIKILTIKSFVNLVKLLKIIEAQFVCNTERNM